VKGELRKNYYARKEVSTMMQASELKIPVPSYSIPEVEMLLNLPTKTGYRLVREHQLRAYKDATGKLRVSYPELYAFVRNREEEQNQ
jgi:hypothetical protein